MAVFYYVNASTQGELALEPNLCLESMDPHMGLRLLPRGGTPSEHEKTSLL